VNAKTRILSVPRILARSMAWSSSAHWLSRVPRPSSVSGGGGMLKNAVPSTEVLIPAHAMHELRAILHKLAQAGTSIIAVTHHLPDIIPEIDRVILIKKGRVLRDGAKRDVLTSGLLSELFETPVELVERAGLYQIW
jgi:hypothetical protein